MLAVCTLIKSSYLAANQPFPLQVYELLADRASGPGEQAVSLEQREEAYQAAVLQVGWFCSNLWCGLASRAGQLCNEVCLEQREEAYRAAVLQVGLVLWTAKCTDLLAIQLIVILVVLPTFEPAKPVQLGQQLFTEPAGQVLW